MTPLIHVAIPTSVLSKLKNIFCFGLHKLGLPFYLHVDINSISKLISSCPGIRFEFRIFVQLQAHAICISAFSIFLNTFFMHMLITCKNNSEVARTNKATVTAGYSVKG